MTLYWQSSLFGARAETRRLLEPGVRWMNLLSRAFPQRSHSYGACSTIPASCRARHTPALSRKRPSPWVLSRQSGRLPDSEQCGIAGCEKFEAGKGGEKRRYVVKFPQYLSYLTLCCEEHAK